MALVLNDEQQMLREAAKDFLNGRAPVSHLRAQRDQGGLPGFAPELWAEMAEMGWAAILVPEEFGGLDYGYVGLGIVLEECGRTLTPSPLLATALVGATALIGCGSRAQQEEILPALAAGDHILALACEESSRHDPRRTACEAEDLDGAYRLNGRKVAVPDGQAADTFIVSAWSGDGVSLFLVPAKTPGVTVEPYPVLDTHSAANVHFDHIELPGDCLLGTAGQGQEALDRILDAARIGVAAELLGIAQEAFERTLEYLKERKQFGVPIGSFQALQHRAAHLFAEIELCRSVVLKSLQALDENAPDQAELASLAKGKLSEVTHLATTEAIQMHGGIGMTDAFDIGFFLKRCRILEALYGDHYFHLDRFASIRGY